MVEKILLENGQEMSVDFFITPVIGVGGSGSVILHEENNKKYAIKKPKKVKDAERENAIARIISGKHNAFPIYTFPMHNDVVITDYIPDRTLKYYCREHQVHRNVRRCMLYKLCQGIHEMHVVHHIVHRDIKPENILVKIHNKNVLNFDVAETMSMSDILQGVSVIIIDWAYSLILPLEVGASYDASGSPSYISPEMLIGKNYDPLFAHDIWSLGVTIYMLATGHRPYEATKMSVLAIRQNRFLDNLENTLQAKIIDVQLQDLLMKLFVADPKYRITIQEVIIHPYLSF